MSEIEEIVADAVSAETAVAAPSPRDHARFIRFLIAGGIAASINVATRWALGFVLRYELAIIVAFVAGLTTAFILARTFVFAASPTSVRGQFARFALVNLVALVQIWLVSVVLARVAFPALGITWQTETLAHTVGVLSPVVTSYLAHKHFSFRD